MSACMTVTGKFWFWKIIILARQTFFNTIIWPYFPHKYDVILPICQLCNISMCLMCAYQNPRAKVIFLVLFSLMSGNFLKKYNFYFTRASLTYCNGFVALQKYLISARVKLCLNSQVRHVWWSRWWSIELVPDLSASPRKWAAFRHLVSLLYLLGYLLDFLRP